MSKKSAVSKKSTVNVNASNDIQETTPVNTDTVLAAALAAAHVNAPEAFDGQDVTADEGDLVAELRILQNVMASLPTKTSDLLALLNESLGQNVAVACAAVTKALKKARRADRDATSEFYKSTALAVIGERYEMYRASGGGMKEPALDAEAILKGMMTGKRWTDEATLFSSIHSKRKALAKALTALVEAGKLERTTGLVDGEEAKCYAPTK